MLHKIRALPVLRFSSLPENSRQEFDEGCERITSASNATRM